MKELYRFRQFLTEGVIKENIMVSPIIMFGGKKYIEDVISSPDDFGFDKDDAEWVKNNILSSPKMVSIQDYMDLDDKWIKQAQIDTSGGGALDHVVDGLKIHVKQELITPEQEKEAMKVVGLSEGVVKEDKLVWTIEGEDDSPTIESSDEGYKEAVVSYIKSIHPNISDKNLKKSMEVAEETWYNEGRENAKSGEGEDFDVSVEEFADGAVEYYEDAILDEGVIKEVEEFETADEWADDGRYYVQVEDNGKGGPFIIDPNFSKYTPGTKVILSVLDEQDYRFEDAEDYFLQIQRMEALKNEAEAENLINRYGTDLVDQLDLHKDWSYEMEGFDVNENTIKENMIDEDDFRFFKLTLGDKYSDSELEEFLSSDEYPQISNYLNLANSDVPDWDGEIINYFHDKGKLNENEDDSYYIDEIKRDLEELDDKEANEYLEDLAKSILKLKK